ncbi:MAG TPA: hypothetical protein VIF81_02150 [Pyrinomonadaceae bacterium]
MKKLIDKQKSESDKLEGELTEKKQLIQALAYLLDVSPETNSGAATDHSKIRVQYFSKDIKPEALLALQQFGFSLDDKRPQTDAPTSNLIFFGKNISPTDIRLVAYVLFKSRFKIDDIKPFPKSSGNEDVIQIGDLGKSSASNIPWTLEKIAGIANTNVDLSFLSGAWEGVAYQANYGTWPIRLTVQNGRYFVDYPDNNCKGEWKLTDKSITMVKFRERLTEGIDNCVNNGYVIIRRTDGDFTQKARASQINFNYINPAGKVVTSWGVLNRTR